MVPSPNLWKSQVFRQVLDFFRVRIRGSGSGGIVIFHWIRQSTNCKKPTVSLLNFLSDETTMKTLKNHWNSPCANEPLPDSPNLRKNTCRYFYLDPDLQVPERHKVGKNSKKAATCRRTYARFFENAWKHLQNFFQSKKTKSPLSLKKDQSAFREKYL